MGMLNVYEDLIDGIYITNWDMMGYLYIYIYIYTFIYILYNILQYNMGMTFGYSQMLDCEDWEFVPVHCIRTLGRS